MSEREPFWSSKPGPGAFVIHFSRSPIRDFGTFGRGYARTAKRASEAVLSSSYPDYDVYPIVFLYRHALELYLKGVIAKGLQLDSLTAQQATEKLVYNHDLSALFGTARSVLRRAFPSDTSLETVLAKIGAVVTDFVTLDGSSYEFRYPVNKKGERPVPGPVYGNLASLSETMNESLEELEAIVFGLDVGIDQAHEILELMLASDDHVY